MKLEYHKQAFDERKETIFKWGIEVRGIENSQRIIGDNASKAVCELLSAYLLKERIVESGFQLNHSWFKSEKIMLRLPDFQNKKEIVSKMVELEKLCEQLSYGSPKSIDNLEQALALFRELEEKLRGMLQW